MLTTNNLLDLARERQGGVTDYRISKLLDLKPQHISGYRSGRTRPANPIAMRLAELAGVDPMEAVVAVNLERATSPEDREVWEKLLARVSAPKRRKLAD